MPLWRYRVPKIARRPALGHMNDYDWENQSCGRDRSSRRWSRTVLTGAGMSEPSSLNTRCAARSVATTFWTWICLGDLMRSAHCRSTRRWKLNGYTALIGSTSLTFVCKTAALDCTNTPIGGPFRYFEETIGLKRLDSASLKHCPENMIPKRRGDAVVSVRK
jgi:hypothetical protein